MNELPSATHLAWPLSPLPWEPGARELLTLHIDNFNERAERWALGQCCLH